MRNGETKPDEDELGMPSCGRSAALAGLADKPASWQQLDEFSGVIRY